MTLAPLLITTFQPWRAHQPSNSSDDLVATLAAQGRLPNNSVLLRRVPVSFDIAPIRVLSEIHRIRPHAVICCGMAEKRPYLSLEQRAKGVHRHLQTTVDLPALLEGTVLSQISYDAGTYVCNHLYYKVLESVSQSQRPIGVIFAHIPPLNPDSTPFVLDDFCRISANLNRLHCGCATPPILNCTEDGLSL
ncbi:MAG: peptidase C15 [Cyanobacteria bacterium J06623_4]